MGFYNLRLQGMGVFVLLVIGHVLATYVDPTILDGQCPGYDAIDVQTKSDGLRATLVLRKQACNKFGDDITKLQLGVAYETANRIHVKIIDVTSRYEVPESVLPLPLVDPSASPSNAVIGFNYTSSPFSFTIYRKSTNEVLFSTENYPIIFEPQYIRIKTKLPDNANIYGLGEHSNSFRLSTDNTTLTLWNRDAFGLPTGTNLYGAHPVYFEHRTTGTHGVFFRNSNGMDIKINDTGGSTTLEYSVIGGVIDLYFLAGSETDPAQVARQYAQVVGNPAEVPYWSLGFHQCRFGYKDYTSVANVITNYSAAKIPLETMWTDIDYMDSRRIFTVDPKYFPLNRMQEIINYLHHHEQKYVLMTDPAVAYDVNYDTYTLGHELDVFLKLNGNESLGVVWPGVTVFPDWFHPKISEFWNKKFQTFFDASTGLDIDGAWIDMNEPANFCTLPCDDPSQQAKEQNMPPNRDTDPPDPNAKIFTTLSKRDLLNPPYEINNANGPLSSKTAFTSIIHQNGLSEYDTHNLYGTMMSSATRDAMLARRPGRRTLVITRSTFAGAGSYAQKWLGDNLSTWEHYRSSIAQMLAFASIYQMPMVGSDICGFGANTTENLCARWATLGAFYPFMRNHNIDTGISQEFYVWNTVADAARKAIDIRYRLLDYMYTAFHQASVDGTPVLHPLWNKYPKDPNTFGIDLQFFYGDSILVSPVTTESTTSVVAYFPNDDFYDFNTLQLFRGSGSNVTLDNIDLSSIPLHIKGGTVLPLRVESTMTTDALRKKAFQFIVAPHANGEASGQLYLDDGETIKPENYTLATFSYKTNSPSQVPGQFTVSTSKFDCPLDFSNLIILNATEPPKTVTVPGGNGKYEYDESKSILKITVEKQFNQEFTISWK